MLLGLLPQGLAQLAGEIIGQMLDEFAASHGVRFGELTRLGFPLVAAVSNKDFVGEALDRPREERLAGSLAAAVFCVVQGARILRMHNVSESVDASRMVEAIMGWREPAFLRHNMVDGPNAEPEEQ